MLSNLSDEAIVRIVIAAVFVLVIGYIVISSRLRGRGRGKPQARSAVRREPESGTDEVAADEPAPDEPEYREQATLGFDNRPAPAKASQVGKRKSENYEKLVMLYLAAKSGQTISGAELVLATEKVGLVYGHHNIYHRLADGPDAGEPVFSMANVVQPGYFDLANIDALQTPGVSFFMTLPGPVTAVQAWDTMLPIAERMAQLLDAVLLDADRNALGRQRILHIKEELRTFDREKERQNIKPGR